MSIFDTIIINKDKGNSYSGVLYHCRKEKLGVWFLKSIGSKILIIRTK